MAQELPPPPPKKGAGRPPKEALEKVDWPAIRAAYEMGAATKTELSKTFGVAVRTIDRHIEAEGWVSEMTLRQVRTQTAAELIRTDPTTTAVTAADIKSAAQANASIIRTHRAMIERARKTVETLQEQLQVVVEGRDELKRLVDEGGVPQALAKIVVAAMSIASNSGIAKELANAMKVLVELERRAHNIADDDPGEDNKRLPQGDVPWDRAAEVYRRML